MNVREVIFDIIGRDRLSPTLDKIGVRGESARKVMSSLNRQTLTFNDNIKTAAAEIPGLSRGLTMLRNPCDYRRNSYRRHDGGAQTCHGSGGALQP